MGMVDHATGTVRLNTNLTAVEWRSTLAHELLHLQRGPVPPDLEHHEEVAVEHATASLLIPQQALYPLERRWTDDEVRQLAHEHQVDDTVAYDRLDPRTLPLGFRLEVN